MLICRPIDNRSVRLYQKQQKRHLREQEQDEEDEADTLPLPEPPLSHMDTASPAAVRTSPS